MTSLRFRSQRRGSMARALESALTGPMTRTDCAAFSARRRLLTALLLLMCLFVPAACAPGSQSQSQGEGQVTLRVSTWGNDSRLKLTQQAVDAFTAANPDTKVSIENNDWTAYWDKLKETPTLD